jgi:acetyltransferase-like isoleucine patch superfamily enzyme
MPTVVTRLAPYRDDRGNEIVFSGAIDENINIKFSGSNNRLIVADPVHLRVLRIDFDCDNGQVKIGSSEGVPAFSAAIRVGQDSTVRIGKNVSSTGIVTMSAVEGTTIAVGADVMFASENQVRGDDGHAIFDVHTGKRVNVSESIRIGGHVWLGRFATVLGGGQIGPGTVIGYGAIVTGRIPNNCIAVGTPARVIRRDVAWERPHLSLTPPYYKPDSSTVTRSKYWRLTEAAPATVESDAAVVTMRNRFARSRIGRKVLATKAVRQLRRK